MQCDRKCLTAKEEINKKKKVSQELAGKMGSEFVKTPFMGANSFNYRKNLRGVFCN